MNLATLERLNTQLRLISEQQIRTLEQRQRLLESIPTPWGAGRMSVSDSPTADLLEEKRHDLGQLEARFTSQHPDVLRLKQEIAALEAVPARRSVATPEDAMAAGQARGRAAVLANLDAELEKQKREEASCGHHRATERARACRRASRTTRSSRATTVGAATTTALTLQRSAGREHGDRSLGRTVPHPEAAIRRPMQRANQPAAHDGLILAVVWRSSRSSGSSSSTRRSTTWTSRDHESPVLAAIHGCTLAGAGSGTAAATAAWPPCSSSSLPFPSGWLRQRKPVAAGRG
jgi:hypothetical protein